MIIPRKYSIHHCSPALPMRRHLITATSYEGLPYTIPKFQQIFPIVIIWCTRSSDMETIVTMTTLSTCILFIIMSYQGSVQIYANMHYYPDFFEEKIFQHQLSSDIITQSTICTVITQFWLSTVLFPFTWQVNIFDYHSFTSLDLCKSSRQYFFIISQPAMHDHYKKLTVYLVFPFIAGDQSVFLTIAW